MPKKTKKPSELELNTKDAKVAGVASGIADYYHQDPAWVRLVGVVFIILSGIIPGLIIYWAFYALMKKTDEHK
jgi:phage shock protein PspC (stress-responsive transcriptional regulator)